MNIAVKHAFESVAPTSYQVVVAARKDWLQTRSSFSHLPLDRCHFVTVATDEDDPGLHNLYLSAKMAGITIEVRL